MEGGVTSASRTGAAAISDGHIGCGGMPGFKISVNLSTLATPSSVERYFHL